MDAFEERGDVEVADAYAVDGRDDAAQHMVEAAILLGVLDGHDVLDVLDHADDVLDAFGAGTDGAEVRIADAMADAAVADVGCEAADGVGELQHVVAGLAEEVQCETQRRALSHARKGGEGIDSLGQSSRGQLHDVHRCI